MDIRKKSQSGSVSVYILGMLPAMVLALLFVYNSYQLSNERTRLQNSTDAVAYSVGSVSAKDLNFKAYTNRAMVANHVAVAQAVSLQSWVRWLDVFISNIQRLTSWIPGVGSIITGIKQAMNQVEDGLGTVLGAYIRVLDAVNYLYLFAQGASHFAANVMAIDTYAAVAQANDPEIDTGFSIATTASAASFTAAHFGNTRRYSSSTTETVDNRDVYRMDEFRDVTLRSRDPFSWGLTRNYDLFFKIRLGVIKVDFPKAGGTTLLNDANDSDSRDYYTWQSMDTFSMHVDRLTLKGWKSEELPIGWGGAQTGSEHDFSEQSGLGHYRKNPDASEDIDSNPQNDDEDEMGSYSGLRTYYDIRDRGLIDRLDNKILVVLSKPNGDEAVKTVKALDIVPADSQVDLEQYGGLYDDRMTAISAAELYFARPSGLSGWSRGRSSGGSGGVGIEYGNLYNPFWQTRLTSARIGGLKNALGL